MSVAKMIDGRVSTVREKVREKNIFSRSGNCQGILEFKQKSGKCQGILKLQVYK